MEETRLPRNVFAIIVLIALAMAIHDYPLLPGRLASHFGASGMANGWMSKPQFFLLYAGMIVLAYVVGLAAPRFIAAMPVSRINLPHKEYWLAPERRDETFAFFRRHFAWYGCAVLLLEVVVIELAVRANFQTPPLLPSALALFLVAAFVAFNVVWMVGIFRRFPEPP